MFLYYVVKKTGSTGSFPSKVTIFFDMNIVLTSKYMPVEYSFIKLYMTTLRKANTPFCIETKVIGNFYSNQKRVNHFHFHLIKIRKHFEKH